MNEKKQNTTKKTVKVINKEDYKNSAFNKTNHPRYHVCSKKPKKANVANAGVIKSLMACLPVSGTYIQRNILMDLPKSIDVYRDDFITMIVNSYATRYRFQSCLDANKVSTCRRNELHVLNNFYLEFSFRNDALNLYHITETQDGRILECIHTEPMKLYMDAFENKNALTELYDAFVTAYVADKSNEGVRNGFYVALDRVNFYMNHDIDHNVNDVHLCGYLEELKNCLDSVYKGVSGIAQRNLDNNQRTLFDMVEKQTKNSVIENKTKINKTVKTTDETQV